MRGDPLAVADGLLEAFGPDDPSVEVRAATTVLCCAMLSWLKEG